MLWQVCRSPGSGWYGLLILLAVAISRLVQESDAFLLFLRPTTRALASSTTPTTKTKTVQYQQHVDPQPVCFNAYRSDSRLYGSTLTTLRASRKPQSGASEEEKSSTKTVKTTTTTKRTRNIRTWDENFQLLVEYQETHGNCNVPNQYQQDPTLGGWVQRQRINKDRLSDEQCAKLDELGFSWRLLRTWNESLELLVSYHNQHGHCNVPHKKDPTLGNWVLRQRQERDSRTDEQRTRLDRFGFAWTNEQHEDQWNTMFQRLQVYAKENDGDCNVPTQLATNRTHPNCALSYWVTNQRRQKLLLSKKRRDKLDSLGLIWDDCVKEQADRKWNEMYQRLVQYQQDYGDCLVPSRWTKDQRPSLGIWVATQRRLYRQGILPDDRTMQLDQLKFTWKIRDGESHPNDEQWNRWYAMLLTFREEHGHCNVKRPYEKNKPFGRWVSRQRTHWVRGILPDNRKQRLDEIGFTWSFEEHFRDHWREQYDELKAFQETNGHLRIPYDNAQLTLWTKSQRTQFANGRLDADRTRLLDEIGFRWNVTPRKIPSNIS
jgi:hypothetical protein